MKSQYSYYETQTTLSTFADFRDEAELTRYADQRTRLFSEKLGIPPGYFAGRSVLQFGPDTGEDALVFARSGAQLTLVEPNVRAHRHITAYFERFGLRKRLDALVTADVEEFRCDRQFDFIDAEGFIYTVQPTSGWLASFNHLLKLNGLFVVTYYERLGGFMELCLKALYRSALSAQGGSDVAVARSLYGAKWDSIPHTRRFESWVMDMNAPFVRLKYFLGAAELCREAFEHGCQVYSSWPMYKDALDLYWHKQILSREEVLSRSNTNIARSALSFLTGYKCYLHSSDLGWVKAVADELGQLVSDVDGLIDGVDCGALDRIRRTLAKAQSLVSSDDVLSNGPQSRARAAAFLESLKRAFEYLQAGDLEGLKQHTSSDADFIAGWGMPNHVAVFEKFSES
jgi:hypothetical protein